jgi:hypothetical protein
VKGISKKTDGRCNDLTVPYPTGSISLTDPFVDHKTNHIDIQLDKSNCVVDYSFPHPTAEERMEERRKRREERLAKLEKERHRLPPFIVLPLPGPLKHVRLSSLPVANMRFGSMILMTREHS